MQLLDEVRQALEKDINAVSNQLVTADLTETQATKLSERIQNLVNTATVDVATLHSELIQAEGALRAASVPSSPPSDRSTDGSTVFNFGSEWTRHLASLTAALERNRTPSGNINYYGYDKLLLPEYSGNVQEYTKWRSQVKDYLEQTAK